METIGKIGSRLWVYWILQLYDALVSPPNLVDIVASLYTDPGPTPSVQGRSESSSKATPYLELTSSMLPF